MYNIQSTLHNVYFKQHTTKLTLYRTHYIVYTIKITLHTVVYTVKSTLHNIQYTVYREHHPTTLHHTI